MRLSVAVQHHPRRADLLPPLLDRLPGADVVCDPDPDGYPSPWRTYRACLETRPADATHALVLQDDVEVCSSFLPAVLEATAARPDRLLVLFHGGQPRENVHRIYRAANLGEPWAELDTRRFCPAVALCWPLRLREPLLEFVDRQGWPEKFRADDEIIGRFLRHSRTGALATVPSLVEHPDVEPSLLGRRARAGGDRGRVAACWIADCDPLTIDWTRGSL